MQKTIHNYQLQTNIPSLIGENPGLTAGPGEYSILPHFLVIPSLISFRLWEEGREGRLSSRLQQQIRDSDIVDEWACNTKTERESNPFPCTFSTSSYSSSASSSSYAVSFIFLLQHCSLDPLEAWMAPHCLQDGLCWRWDLSTIPLPFTISFSKFSRFSRNSNLLLLDLDGPSWDDFACWFPLCWGILHLLGADLNTLSSIDDCFEGVGPLEYFCTVFGKMLINIARIALKRKLFII